VVVLGLFFGCFFLQLQVLDDLFGVKIPVYGGQTDIIGILSEFAGILFTEKVIAILNDVIEYEKAVSFPHKPDFIGGNGVDLVVFL
jgi:hypothetical protein